MVCEGVLEMSSAATQWICCLPQGVIGHEVFAAQECLTALSGVPLLGSDLKDLPLGLGRTVIGDSLSQPSAGEKNTYALLGKATDPVAEGHIVLDCQARTHQGKRVAVPNVVPKKAAEYRYAVVPCACQLGVKPKTCMCRACGILWQLVLSRAQVGCAAVPSRPGPGAATPSHTLLCALTRSGKLQAASASGGPPAGCASKHANAAS